MKTKKENNKMIAEFVGQTATYSIIHLGVKRHFEGDVILSSGYLSIEDAMDDQSHFEERFQIDVVVREEKLQYHTSWDWLMPVVTKITTQDKYIGLMQRENIMDTVPYGLIEDTYNYVVQFIEWYNTNKG